jgi:glutamate synthase (NADPH/NADH) small chain
MGNPKAFLTVNRKEAGYRPKEERIRDYGEVEQTLCIEDRRLQASRCMDCGVPFCHWACPLGNRMPEYQDLVYKGKWEEAYRVLNQTHPFPEFTGRVCPALCEKSCVQAIEHEAVTIRENEAATAERAYNEGFVRPRIPKFRLGKRVAVVGSGPAGLGAADSLNQLGYDVTVYEKNEAVGGLLRFGIPDFKLNKDVIERRLRILEAEGITFKTGVCIGRDVQAQELVDSYDAVCLCAGAETPRDLKVEGRDVPGVYFALQLLQQQNRVNAGEEIPAAERISAKKKNVLVIGGGDTGSDCVGTANRQGAKSVTQIEVMPKPCEGDNPATPWPMYPMVLKTEPRWRKWNGFLLPTAVAPPCRAPVRRRSSSANSSSWLWALFIPTRPWSTPSDWRRTLAAISRLMLVARHPTPRFSQPATAAPVPASLCAPSPAVA